MQKKFVILNLLIVGSTLTHADMVKIKPLDSIGQLTKAIELTQSLATGSYAYPSDMDTPLKTPIVNTAKNTTRSNVKVNKTEEASTEVSSLYIYKDKNGSTLLTNRASNDANLKFIKVTQSSDDANEIPEQLHKQEGRTLIIGSGVADLPQNSTKYASVRITIDN